MFAQRISLKEKSALREKLRGMRAELSKLGEIEPGEDGFIKIKQKINESFKGKDQL